MRTGWIDFKRLKEELDPAAVLAAYRVELKTKGDQATGFCPLPTHQGERRSPSFSMHLKRGVFHCFGCSAKGNLIEFAARMDGLDPAKPADFRKAAIALRERFQGSPPALKGPPPPKPSPPPAPSASASPANPDLPRLVNAPLDFDLKGLDRGHDYLKGRGFTAQTIDHFGLGYCARGLMKGRVAIPLHDAQGQLIGYAGRLADESAINEDNPKYRFPGQRTREGVVHEFRKSLFVYNGWRIAGPVDALIVVEGFPSVWWLHQLGRPRVVAVMGSSCGAEQARLIVELVQPDGRVWILADGGEAGERCAASLLTQIAPDRLVRWLRLPERKQPTDLSASELTQLFGGGGVP